MPDLGKAFLVLFWTAAIAVPFGAWKLAELVIWAAGHVSISFR